jgi:hypothetical protein
MYKSDKNKIQKLVTFKVTNTTEIPQNINDSSFNNGRWTIEEHKKFIDACLQYGSNWKMVNNKNN